jgi:hypothetical protein
MFGLIPETLADGEHVYPQAMGTIIVPPSHFEGNFPF